MALLSAVLASGLVAECVADEPAQLNEAAKSKYVTRLGNRNIAERLPAIKERAPPHDDMEAKKLILQGLQRGLRKKKKTAVKGAVEALTDPNNSPEVAH